MTRVLVVDDHDFFRGCVVDLVNSSSDLEAVGECRDGDEVRAAVQQLRPDVVLMDVQMEQRGGLEAMADLAVLSAPPRVLVLSSDQRETTRASARARGAAGYLVKGARGADVLAAIREIACGGAVWPEGTGAGPTSMILGGGTMELTRRDALRYGGLAAFGGAALALPLGRKVSAGTPSLLASKNMPKPYAAAFQRLGVLVPTVTSDADGPIHRYDIWAKPGRASILPGLTTPVLGYNGVVPAKRIDVQQGVRIEMTMHNRIPAVHPTFGTPVAISTHLHGSASLPQYDGYASDICGYQEKKYYHYPNFQPARTLWYHDHGVHYTAQNAYSGLASQYHLHDATERALLPQGDFDVALTVSDMMFQADGSQLYDDRAHSGLWGDVVLVNGVPWPVMKVQKRVYRFRMLNASLSRSYRPTLSDGSPVYMVATDGGLMPKSQAVGAWRHGSAERYEFLVDFRKYKTGTRVELKNLSNPNNRDFDNTGKIMAFDVTDEPVDQRDGTWNTIPNLLNPGSDVMSLTPTRDMKVVNLRVQRDDTTNEWNLNGQTWHEVVDSEYKKVLANPQLGETQIWEIENKSGGWFHPVHIHLIDFKVLDRNGNAPFAWELGPKDVVYVGEGEKVRVMMKFGPHRGKYMVHCHNLPHEDHDMMHQFSVGLKDGEVDDNDPIHADPAVADDSTDDS